MKSIPSHLMLMVMTPAPRPAFQLSWQSTPSSPEFISTPNTQDDTRKMTHPLSVQSLHLIHIFNAAPSLEGGGEGRGGCGGGGGGGEYIS